MWTEHVDATNLECRLWPRGGAVAASLWGLDAASQDCLSPSSTGSVTDRDLQYAAASGKALVLAYIRHRYFLAGRGVAASDLTFHEVDDSVPAWYRSYAPRSFTTEQEVYRFIDNQNTVPISGYKRFDIGSLHLTSQCPVIDKDVFRPLSTLELKHTAADGEDVDIPASRNGGSAEEISSSNTAENMHYNYNVLRAVQINVADGFPGDRRALMTTWLKEKANNGVDIIGELFRIN